MKIKNTTHGFTLIEVIIYMALFSIFIGGAIVCSFNLIESSHTNSSQNLLAEEGNFILDKIHGSLVDTKEINIPGPHMSGTTLSITTFDSSTPRPIVFNIKNKNMTIQRGTNEKQILNGQDFKIDSLIFTHTDTIIQTISVESVTTEFSLSTLTPNGKNISQKFSETIYVKK